jgi:hypothetical protein
LATLPQQGSAYKAAFDNVTLNAATLAVPEPESWTLLVSGGLALGYLMRRR